MCPIAAALESISEVIYTRPKLVSKFYFSKVDFTQFNSFLFLHKQVKIVVNIMIKITSMEKKGHTELLSSSLKLIARKIGKRRQFFWLNSSGLIMYYLLGHKVHHLTKNTAKVDAD